jgi:hypothetical protein
MGRMAGEPLTALIGAYEPGLAGLRALMPLAGATLVEQQARRAVAAGATHVLLLVEEVPPDLVDAVQRLRHDGVTIGMAEGIDAAADALSDQNVLLIADACLPDPDLLRALAELPVPSVATLADLPDHSRHERIDASTRWAGVALIDGRRVAETATMLGSWDPVSTLLRRAVQEGAMRLGTDETPPMLLVDPATLASAEAAIVAAARRPAGNWIARSVFGPAEELALPLLLGRRIEAVWLALLAASLSLLGGALAWAGWRWPALVSLLAAGPIAAGATRLARVQARPIIYGWLFDAARLGGAAIAAVGLADSLVRISGQWGWWLTGAVLLGGMVTLDAACRIRKRSCPLWLASVDACAWTMLPFAIFGRWGIGLGALAAYACLSFAWVMAKMVREEEKKG